MAALTACASNPFVGHWRAEDLNTKRFPGPDLSLYMQEGGTFVGAFEGGEPVGAAGTWEQVTDTRAEMAVDKPERVATLDIVADLVYDDRLLVTVQSDPPMQVRLKRAAEER